MIKTGCMLTRTLCSLNLTELKFRELYNLAIKIRDLKNKTSEYVFEHMDELFSLSNEDFVKKMRSIFYHEIAPSFDYQLYTHVFTCYKNKFDNILKSITFESKEFVGVKYYKRDTKLHKKGDFNKFIIITHKSMLCIALTWLARYGQDNSYDYIVNRLKLSELEDEKREFYSGLLRVFDKFGYEKLYSLALSKRNRLLEKYNKYPVEFTSLTFGGRSRKTNIISRNKNRNSVLETFISLSGFENYDSFDIPVKYSRKWHGNLNELNRSKSNNEYVLCVDEYNHSVKINLVIKRDVSVPSVKGTEYEHKCIGADINVKHNLISLSDGKTFDYNRELMNEYLHLLKLVDERKKNDKDYVPGVKLQHKIDCKANDIKEDVKSVVRDACVYLQQQGEKHLAMEELKNEFKKCYAKTKNVDGITEDDLNYNRLVKALNLSSIKNVFKEIAPNYDLCISTVHSAYTSKMCSECGLIDDKNRKCQEEFICVNSECTHSENADLNAAKNIRNRVSEAVLQEALLKQCEDGSFEPIPMKLDTIKRNLISFRDNVLSKKKAQTE